MRQLALRERQEYLALLARWYYSSWRDGEWLPIEDFDSLPYRKLVHAISRVAQVGQREKTENRSQKSEVGMAAPGSVANERLLF
jgi:hypothetical protein